MKKILLGILIVIVIGAIAAPYLNGLMMEKVLYSQLEKVRQVYKDQPFYPEIEITRYDRRFGTSEIEWTLTMPQLQQAFDGIDHIILVEKAKHGYMGVTSKTSLNKNSWYTKFIREELNDKDPLTISNRYNLFSGITSTVLLESFELRDEKDNRFIINPGEIVIKTDSALENMLTNAYFEGFSIPGQVDVRGISLQSDVKEVSSIIWDSETTFSIQQANIRDKGKDHGVEISTLRGRSTLDFDEAAGKLSTSIEYSADHILADDKKIDDFSLKIGINQLDAEGIENIYSVYADMLNDMMANFATLKENPEQAKAEMDKQMALVGMRLVPELEKLLKKDLQVEITDLHLTLPEGEIKGDVAISLKKDMTLTDFIALSQQPEKLVEVFTYASNITLPVNLIANQDNLLVPMLPGMQSGVFEKLGQRLVHQAEIKNDKLFLNGKEFVLRQD